MFVHLPGRSVAQAFEIGRVIAAAVTAANPTDVVLQFEKVYGASVLVSKKRYVGYCFEDERQTVPNLDAKGVEIVRRDSCPAVGKMQEKALRLLFSSKDGSKVKAWLVQQWTKLLSNKGVRAIDYIFAKEVSCLWVCGFVGLWFG
jgi:DNA polymerase zeta